MNKWYRSAPVKGVLLLVQHVLVVLAVISLVWLAAYPGMTQDIFSGETETSYARSEGFGQQPRRGRGGAGAAAGPPPPPRPGLSQSAASF